MSMSSTIDPEKLYPVYLNLAHWEKASGKNLKLTETKPAQPGKSFGEGDFGFSPPDSSEFRAVVR